MGVLFALNAHLRLQTKQWECLIALIAYPADLAVNVTLIFVTLVF